jgi:hypothetical protein
MVEGKFLMPNSAPVALQSPHEEEVAKGKRCLQQHLHGIFAEAILEKPFKCSRYWKDCSEY